MDNKNEMMMQEEDKDLRKIKTEEMRETLNYTMNHADQLEVETLDKLIMERKLKNRSKKARIQS